MFEASTANSTYQTSKVIFSTTIYQPVKFTPCGTMSDETYDDDVNGVHDPFYYEDPISERAMVFLHVAKLTDEVKDADVRELCLTVLKKLNASIRVPTGELRSIEKSKK